MRERKCEAPIHSVSCPCERCTRSSCEDCHLTSEDHFQARAIAKVWGNDQFGKKENFQWLSRACHERKDLSTPARKYLLKEILEGKEITLEEYRKFRNKNDCVYVDVRRNNYDSVD